MAKIILKFNDSVIREIELNRDRLTIGRHLKNDIQIDNLAVSNFHARIEKILGHYYLEDLDSTNGTFINDRRIGKWALNPDDAVTIGKHTLVFLLQEHDADGTGPDPRNLQMDKTMILDTRAHRERLAKVAGKGDPAYQGSPLGVLTILKGGVAGQREFVLTDRLTLIGKDDGAGVKLDGFLVPRIGGFVARDENGYTLIPPDHGGKIKINGRPVDNGVLLQDDDRIEVGDVTMSFHLAIRNDEQTAARP